MAILKSIDSAFQTTAVAVPTTTETAIIASPLIATPRDVNFAVVRGSVQLTSGTGTTTVAPAIRRGNTTAGTLVGAQNANAIQGAAGGTGTYEIEVREERDFTDYVQYVLTVLQAAATGNGSAIQAHILVMIF